MQPYVNDRDFVLYVGDVTEVLAGLPDESVHCVVTSPPYWGLRDYGTGSWAGGDPDCDHKQGMNRQDAGRVGVDGFNGSTLGGAGTALYRDVCGKCGARRVDQQLGLEPTPEAYVENMVAVFREVRRVLRRDGTCWLNIGDSYANDTKWGGASGEKNYTSAAGGYSRDRKATGLKAKDLVGIPWRLAFALQQDGWVLRSDIVWSKPNPMPESVTDRATKAHEYVFMLTKAKWVGAIEPTPMAQQDAAWLAALVDGEGSICFQERANKEWAPTISPRLSVVNTNRDLLERVAEITALAVNDAPSPRPRGDGSEGRPVWTWQITDKKAARILTAIRPYLIAKRRQADLALAVYALNAKLKGRRIGRTSDADLVFKRRAAAACSELNRGREPDLSWFTPPRDGRWIPESYYFDADAVREPFSGNTHSRGSMVPRDMPKSSEPGSGVKGQAAKPPPQAETLEGLYECSRCGVVKTKSDPVGGCGACGGPLVLISGEPPRGPDGRRQTHVEAREGSLQHRNGERWPGTARNLRSVWEIATQPYPEAHFATYPEALVERCVKAGTSERGCCPECGAPWERETDGGDGTYADRKALGYDKPANMKVGVHEGHHNVIHPPGMTHDLTPKQKTTTGWKPTCACYDSPPRADLHGSYPAPCVVLDPFMGSGTTALVARKLGRRSIGVELNESYAELAGRRTRQLSLLTEGAT